MVAHEGTEVVITVLVLDKVTSACKEYPRVPCVRAVAELEVPDTLATVKVSVDAL